MAGRYDLTNAMKATLKAYILADPELGPLSSGPGTDYGYINNALNAPSNPATQAWRCSVQPRETDQATPWTGFDAIAQASKRDSFLHGFLRFERDYTENPVRKWITDVWGNATVGSNAYAILTGAGQEVATRAQVVIGGNVRTTNDASALVRSYVGQLSIELVSDILNDR